MTENTRFHSNGGFGNSTLLVFLKLIRSSRTGSMLYVTRCEGETIVINETITIKIVHAQDGVVNLEIDAPDEVVTVRQESLDNH